jgi:hypothetical protein
MHAEDLSALYLATSSCAHTLKHSHAKHLPPGLARLTAASQARQRSTASPVDPFGNFTSTIPEPPL